MKWFLGSLVVLLIALALGLGLLAYTMYALLGVLLLSRWMTKVWAESLDARRECNRLTAEIGDRVAVVLTVENRGPLPIAWVLVEDLLPRDVLRPPKKLVVHGSRVQVASLRPRTRKSLLYQLQFTSRGYYQIGPLVAETGDLFGLHRRYRVVTRPHFVLVYPEVIPVAGWDIASRRPIGEVRMSYRLFEDPTRIAGVRDYEPGDPLNRVHWKATARAGSLQCKVLEPSTVAGATLLLEFNRSAFDPAHEPVRSELAITLTASLAGTLYQMNQQVGLVSNARDAVDRIKYEGWAHDYRSRSAAHRDTATRETSDRLAPLVVETRRGPDQYMRILETLARAELTDGLSLAQLVLETAARLPRDATVIAVLPSVSVETALSLGNLRRRGFAVEAIIVAYYDHEYERAAGPLAAEGIASRHVRDKDGIATLCQGQMVRR